MSNENVEILNLSVIITQDDYLFKVIFDPQNEEESIDLEFKIEESNQREEEDRFIIEFNLIENDSNKN
jgi:hypothetical protein